MSDHSLSAGTQRSRILISYGQADAAIAETLARHLAEATNVDIDRYVLEKGVAPSDHLVNLFDEHDAVVQLVSLSFLKSLGCMREVIGLIQHDEQRARFRERTIPILIPADPEDIDVTTIAGQIHLVKYWADEAINLDEGLTRTDVGVARDELRADLVMTRDVSELIMRFTRTLTDNIYATTLHADMTRVTEVVMSHLREIMPQTIPPSFQWAAGSEQDEAPASAKPGNGRSVVVADDNENEYRKHLRSLAEAIVVPSESDPSRPEFPPYSPRFPATPTERVAISSLGREIWIKDESHNFTGSHKDRMAWEIVVHYKKTIEDLLDGSSEHPVIPRASIISNGSAALAIQVMLRCYGLPDLKVLVDRTTDRRVVRRLRHAGCEVEIHDRSSRELESRDVQDLTENPDGFDFTARSIVDPTRRKYYDWLAYEILNQGARHIFVPVGTGDLFVNILRVVRDELTGVTRDPRLSGGSRAIEGLELYGATSDDWRTKMDKLYAAHRPTLAEAKRFVEEMRTDGHCGQRSGIYSVGEHMLTPALEAAHAAHIRCDESGIAGLALLLELDAAQPFQALDEILVVNTGWLALP
jgi:cysteine synthase